MFLRIIKTFFSFSYLFLYYVKIFLFYFKQPASVEPFVLSVGNLTVGGSGKTPMVEYLSTFLSSNNINHSIVSRGYKRNNSKVVVVSDGSNVLASVDASGDEPFLLAHALPRIPVVVGNKLEALQLAENLFVNDVIVIDDGFQTTNIVRDLDVVLIDLSVNIKHYRLLPLGYLREPLRAIKRADVIVFTKHNYNVGDAQKIKSLILPYVNKKTTALFDANYATSLKKYSKKQSCFISCGQKISYGVVAFCGVANSAIFIKSLSSFCEKTSAVKTFPDHHCYSKKNIHLIKQLLLADRSSAIITTKKDFYKVKDFFKGYSIFIIDVEHTLKQSSSFSSFLHKKIIVSG